MRRCGAACMWRIERARGGAPLRVGPRDGAQDAALPPAARVSPGATGPASEAGRLHGIIDQILREDQSRPKKQRHTAKRIGERLRAEYGFTGGDMPWCTTRDLGQ